MSARNSSPKTLSVKEVWKDVPGYEGYYQASTLGRIRSIPRLVKHKCGGDRIFPGKVLKPGKNGSGYLFVMISKNGKSKPTQVHTIILNTFVGPCPKGMEARHFPNQNKLDNRPANLQWATRQVNMKDKEANGTAICGMRIPWSKLTDDEVRQIRIWGAQYGPSQIAKMLGNKVQSATISQILRGQAWKSVM